MSGTLKIAALLVVGTTVLASAAWVEAQRAPAKTVVGNLSFGPIVYTDASYRPLRKQPTSFKGGEDFIFTIEVTPTEGFILGPTPKYTPFSVPLRAELYTPKPPADPKDKKAAAAYAQEKAATITALLINWDQKALPPPVAVTVAGEKSKGYPATIQLKFKGSFSKLKAGEKLTGKFGVAIMGQSGNKNEKPMTLPPGFRVESAMITVTG